MENAMGSRWVGWLIIILFAVTAVAMSIRQQGMREGKSGSYLGRSVMDGTPPGETERALGSRIRTQNY
jgi:hypothetical protein